MWNVLQEIRAANIPAQSNQSEVESGAGEGND
jgi:hypothetical protein